MHSSISNRKVLQLNRISDGNAAACAQCQRSGREAIAAPAPFLSSAVQQSKARLTDLRSITTAKSSSRQEVSPLSATGQRNSDGQPSSHTVAAAAASSTTQPILQLPPPVAHQFPCGEFSLAMQVRDYELDQFSVVNNAVYSSYFQHARHEAFAALGHDVDEYGRRGTPLALSNMNITFRAPLRSRDSFRVTVTVNKVTGARVVMHQRILRRVPQPPQLPQPPLTSVQPLTVAKEPLERGASECESKQLQGAEASGAGSSGGVSGTASEGAALEEELVAEAEAVVVFLDAAYRPSRVPRDVARLFQTLLDLRQ